MSLLLHERWHAYEALSEHSAGVKLNSRMLGFHLSACKELLGFLHGYLPSRPRLEALAGQCSKGTGYSQTFWVSSASFLSLLVLVTSACRAEGGRNFGAFMLAQALCGYLGRC